MDTQTFYGIAHPAQAVAFATRVCDVIGHGSTRKAVPMLLETSATETLVGQYRDDTLYYAGAGICQTDESTFDWLKEKYQDSSIAKRIKEELNIDLRKVSYQELDYSPMLSFIFARLRYWVVEAPIPASVEGRAQYWKDHYNSHAENAKGTPEKYLERVKQCAVYIRMAA